MKFDNFTITDLKSRITMPTGAGGFRADIKMKALKELIKRQKKGRSKK